jgi:hypothetical protein
VTTVKGMSLSRTTIATVATIAALGVLAAVALASGGEEPTAAAPAPTAETDPPVEVRTQVVRRTIHKRPKAATSGVRAASSSGGDDGTLDQGPGDRPRIPVAAAPPAAAPAPATSGPGPSGPSGGHHDDFDDDHHGDDDDDFDDDHHGDDDHGDDDSGHGRGRGRGRGRGGDDD